MTSTWVKAPSDVICLSYFRCVSNLNIISIHFNQKFLIKNFNQNHCARIQSSTKDNDKVLSYWRANNWIHMYNSLLVRLITAMSSCCCFGQCSFQKTTIRWLAASRQGWLTIRETLCHFEETADHQISFLANCGLKFGVLLLGPEEQRQICM